MTTDATAVPGTRASRLLTTATRTWNRVPWLRYLVAPILCIWAASVHFSLNVPRTVRHAATDQGAPERRTRAAAKLPARTVDRAPRSPAQLQSLWEQYGGAPLADEPVHTAWARKAQAHLNKAVVVARNHAFAGAPEPPQVIVASVQCRTVRCELILHGPFVHEVDLLVGALERVTLGQVSLWREFKREASTAPEGSPKDQAYVRVVLGFLSDDVDPDRIAVVDGDAAAAGVE